MDLEFQQSLDVWHTLVCWRGIQSAASFTPACEGPSSCATKSTYQLREAQLAAGKKDSEVLGVVQDMKTRWTLAYFMLKRCVDIADHIQTVLSNTDRNTTRYLALSGKDVYEMKELSAALQPLCLAMQGKGGETYCSLSMAEPLLNKILTKALQATEDEMPIVYDFKTAAYGNFARRYQDDRRGCEVHVRSSITTKSTLQRFCFCQRRSCERRKKNFCWSRSAKSKLTVTCCLKHLRCHIHRPIAPILQLIINLMYF